MPNFGIQKNIGRIRELLEAGRISSNPSEHQEILKKITLQLNAIDSQDKSYLRDSNGFLEVVLSALPGLVSYVDRDLNYRYVNQAYENWFGLSREQCLHATMYDVVGEAAVKVVQSHLSAAFKGDRQDFECDAPYTHGGKKCVRVQYIPDKDASGVTHGIIVIVDDINREKMAIEEKNIALNRVTEKSKRIQALFNQSADPIMTLAAPDWKFTSCNPAALKLFEVASESDFKNLGPGDLSPIVQSDGRLSVHKAEEMIQLAIESGKHLFDWDHKTTSGKVINCTVLLNPVSSGSERYLQATVRDVTESKRNEKLYNGIFRHAPLGIIYIDSSFRYRSVNPAYESFLGYTEQELLEKTIIDVTHPEDRQKTLDKIRDLPNEKDGILKSFEKRYIHKSGRTLWGRVSSQTITSSSGEVLYLSVIEDVTAQKENHIETSIIFETMADGLTIQDQSGHIEKCNVSALELLGLTEEQLKAIHSISPRLRFCREDFSQFPPDEYPSVVARKTGKPVKGTLMGLILENGSYRWVRVNAVPFDGSSGRQVACTFSDVTEFVSTSFENARLAKEAVESQAVLQSIADNIPGLISKVDQQGRYVFANKVYYDWIGKKPEDIIGLRHRDILPPEVYVKAEPWIKRALSGHRVSFENSTVTRSGDQLEVHTQMIPHRTIDGSPDGFFTVVHDITALKNAESKLIQASKLASLGEMSAGIAHEINNPLAIITGAIGLLSKFSDNPIKLASKIETIRKSCDRISRIILSLKKFSRSGHVGDRRNFALIQIVSEAIVLTEAKSKRHATPVQLVCNSQANIWCDDVEIEQVLVNLINNAIDAVKARPEKWVKVELFEDASSVAVRVTDSGPGIPESVRSRLFEPFFTTKKVGEGTGLGLSITKGILDEHSATITVVADVPNTCFEIRFLRAEGMRNAA